VAEYEAARSEGRVAIADIDVQGVDEYLDMKPDTHAVFLVPPSGEVWFERLSGRYGGNLEEHRGDLETRMRSALRELKHVTKDSRYIVLVNDDLDSTVKRVEEIVSGEVKHTSEMGHEAAEELLGFIGSQLQKGH
jgi:guanylate kinase